MSNNTLIVLLVLGGLLGLSRGVEYAGWVLFVGLAAAWSRL